MEPGLETLRLAQRRKVAPGLEERDLHGVLRAISVSDDPHRRRVQPIYPSRSERAERFAIAIPRSLDKIQHWLSAAGAFGPGTRYGRVGRGRRSRIGGRWQHVIQIAQQA